ncbi:radical SAM protein [bacterium]|nr:radical SAM protein [bacterium]
MSVRTETSLAPELPARPSWLKVRRLSSQVREMIDRSVGATATVCKEANCPNIGQCWARGTATYMLMGDTCTRNCAFCDVNFGKPRPLDPAEPRRVAESVQGLGLKYTVMTCVDRDDLPDSGAAHWVATIEAIRELCGELVLDLDALHTTNGRMSNIGGLNNDSGTVPSEAASSHFRPPTSDLGQSTAELWTTAYVSGTGIEILTGDFKGDEESIRSVVRSRPDVFAHNVETVPELQKLARHKATWERSLRVLDIAREEAARLGHSMFTKTALMLGLGETDQQVREALAILRERGVDLVTIGQYLMPRAIPGKLAVQRFVPPDEFGALRDYALELGFAGVASSPLVRSSYMAETLYARALARSRQ